MLYSYSRLRQLPSGSQRRRAAPYMRRGNYNNTSLTGDQADTVASHSPTNVKQARTEFRANAGSEFRRRIPDSKSPKQLLRLVADAADRGVMDASVVSVAMKKCGNRRWWEALLEVRDMQRSAGVISDVILQSIYLTALAACTKGQKGFATMQERSQLIVRLGKEVWSEAKPNLVSLSSALKLCEAVEHQAGLEWAQALQRSPENEVHRRNGIVYTLYAQLLESHGLQHEVDEMLQDFLSVEWNVSTKPLLGGLVNKAGENLDWRRADELWHTLVFMLGVKPHSIQYTSYAKAHMMCGRPHVAARKMDEMMDQGLTIGSFSAAVDHTQWLLLTYHSSLSDRDAQRLKAALKRGSKLMEKGSRLEKESWKEITSAAQQVLMIPTQTYLRDVLIDWKGKQRSVMSSWANHAAGSQYLTDLE